MIKMWNLISAKGYSRKDKRKWEEREIVIEQ